METDVEREAGTGSTGKARIGFEVLSLLVAGAVFLLAGAQLAFLVGLPHASTLIRDPHSMWLVFSTWPEMRFGLFYLLLVPACQIVTGRAGKRLNPAGALHAIRGMSRPAIVASIGISVFLLPLILAMPSVFLYLATLILCAGLGCFIFVRASRIGVPPVLLWMFAALSLGFFGNLLTSQAEHSPFTCRAGAVTIESGESLPCRNLVWLSGKPLWLLEGPGEPWLILRSDIDRDQLDKALGFPSSP